MPRRRPPPFPLPIDLLYLICEHLDKSDVATFRLVNKSFAAVGVRYQYGTVDLCIHESSFSHLLNISLHPHIVNHVKNLVYHNLYLDDTYRNFEKWQKDALRFDSMQASALPQCMNAAANPIEGPGSANGNNGAAPPKRTKRELREIYSRYRTAVKTQKAWWDQDKDHDYLSMCIERFSNLKHICVNSDHWFSTGHTLMQAKRLFGCHLTTPRTGGSVIKSRPEAVRQLTQVIEACNNANVKLETLEAGTVSWEFFTSISRDTLPTTCLHNLVILDLVVSLGWDDREESELFDTPGPEALECRVFFSSGVVRKFLARLTNLRKLHFRIDFLYGHCGHPAGQLNDIVGDCTWPFVEDVCLGGIGTTKDDLMDFLHRHKSTLRNFQIDSMELTEGCSWNEVIPIIRETMHLETASICGDITTRKAGDIGDNGYGDRYDIVEAWNMEWDNLDDVRREKLVELSDYLCGKGSTRTCPLSEIDMDFSGVLE